MRINNMLPAEKNKKTLDILNIMRTRGVPSNVVSPFPGEQKPGSEDVDIGMSGDIIASPSTLGLPQPPLKKKPGSSVLPVPGVNIPPPV
jgi:hypothetical protein